MVRNITKPWQQGGISHIKIPEISPEGTTKWKSKFDPTALETLVVPQHCKHFSQAKGTVFTQEPLATLINNKCTSNFAQQVLAGTANIHDLPINEYTKDLLTHLKTKVSNHQTTTHLLDFEALIQGLKVWSEHTLTSPSGYHLGIYKLLAKDSPTTRLQTTQPPSWRQSPNRKWQQHATSAPHHAQISHHAYPHIWKIEDNLDTTPQKRHRQPRDWQTPQTIHIYKADYNLLLKWFSSRGYPSKQNPEMNHWQSGRRMPWLLCHRPHNHQSTLIQGSQYA